MPYSLGLSVPNIYGCGYRYRTGQFLSCWNLSRLLCLEMKLGQVGSMKFEEVSRDVLNTTKLKVSAYERVKHLFGEWNRRLLQRQVGTECTLNFITGIWKYRKTFKSCIRSECKLKLVPFKSE